MAISKAKKEEILQSIEKKAKDAKSGVLIDFKGSNVSEMEGLRKSLKQEKSSVNVAKKTLIKLGLKNAGLNVDNMSSLYREIASNVIDTLVPHGVVRNGAGHLRYHHAAWPRPEDETIWGRQRMPVNVIGILVNQHGHVFFGQKVGRQVNRQDVRA